LLKLIARKDNSNTTVLLIPNSFFSGEEEKMKVPTPLRNKRGIIDHLCDWHIG
jgi:hypothetical protein